MRKLYDTFVPGPVKSRIYNAHLYAFMRSFRDREVEFINATPYVELSERHIANVKLVTDRIALLSLMPTGGIVAELGVWRGDFSEAILRITRPTELHLIDPWDLLEPGEKVNADLTQSRFEKEVASGRVVIHRGFSHQELEKFSDGYFDWVYIDADHTYLSTARELQLCRTKVRKGGIIAGHDYTKGDWAAMVRYGVVEAVNEFCETYGWEMIYLTNETHRYLSFALRETESGNSA